MCGLMKLFTILVLVCCSLFGAFCDIKLAKEGPVLSVSFEMKENAYLITEMISVSGEGLKPLENKIPSVPSEDYGAVTKVPFTLKYSVPAGTARVIVSYQGCEDEICHLPESVEYDLNTLEPVVQNAGAAEEKQVDAGVVTGAGFMDAEEFIRWAAGEDGNKNILQTVFDRYGLLLVLLLLLPLGFLLNLTPCVLPMMPINLALIGAGQDVRRRERLLRGIIYGIGMAGSYGTLGLVTVLTGARFGAITASPWFNGAMCAVFIGLGLAMFGIFEIDFARFKRTGKAGSLAGVFVAGVLSAILSGACVAPVLIWALLLAAALYSEGNVIALLIPYMLGLGMALPWPLVAAGMTKLPRPGRWMIVLRRGFAVLIMLFAVYCGFLAWQSTRTSGFHGDAVDYDAALARAKAENKILFLKFRGRVCRACDKMERTTFRDPEVKKLLDGWICVEVDVDDSANEQIVKKFEVKGVPSFALVTP